MTAPHRTAPPEMRDGGADRHQKLPVPMVTGRVWYYGTWRFIKFIGRTKALVVDSACCPIRVADDRFHMATRNPLGTQLARLRRTPHPEQSLPPARRQTPRGQSLVEFALVLPMLLVLLLGIADFGRVFAAGITMESAARDAAEAAAQDYLQLRREATPASVTDLARVTATAVSTVCEEAERLPDRQMVGSACVLPYTAVCIHDDPAELVAYGSACGAGSGSAPPQCTHLHDPWPSLWTTGRLPSIEVRTCYRFDTLFNLRDLHLPLANGLSLGSIWLQRDRVFTVADY